MDTFINFCEWNDTYNEENYEINEQDMRPNSLLSGYVNELSRCSSEINFLVADIMEPALSRLS